jgi:hypothetical protein
MEIELTLERIEDGWAVLKTSDGNEISWPKNFLPMEAKAGIKLVFSITDAEQFASQKNIQAKEILNEILSPEHSQ